MCFRMQVSARWCAKWDSFCPFIASCVSPLSEAYFWCRLSYGRALDGLHISSVVASTYWFVLPLARTCPGSRQSLFLTLKVLGRISEPFFDSYDFSWLMHPNPILKLPMDCPFLKLLVILFVSWPGVPTKIWGEICCRSKIAKFCSHFL